MQNLTIQVEPRKVQNPVQMKLNLPQDLPTREHQHRKSFTNKGSSNIYFMKAKSTDIRNYQHSARGVNSSIDTNARGKDTQRDSNEITPHNQRRKVKPGKDPQYPHFAGNSWLSVVLKGQYPPTRCNMGYAADQQYMYIFGGQDLNSGILDSIWRINL